MVVVAGDCVLTLGTTGALGGPMAIPEVMMPAFGGMEDGLPAPLRVADVRLG